MNKFVLRNDTNHNSEQLYITNGEQQPDETENILEENDANLDANQNTESEHPCNIDEQAFTWSCQRKHFKFICHNVPLLQKPRCTI